MRRELREGSAPQGRVVGVSIRQTVPSGQAVRPIEGRFCDFVGLALGGQSFAVSSGQISCPLARYVLGVNAPSDESVAKLMEGFLGWGVRNRGVAETILASLPRLPVEKRIFEFFPMPTRSITPDVILWFGHPVDAMERVIGFSYKKGLSTVARLNGVGALCGECFARVLSEGDPVVSLGCRGSRPCAGILDDEIVHAATSVPNGDS